MGASPLINYKSIEFYSSISNFMKNLIYENCVLVMRIGEIQCTAKLEVVFVEL